MAKTYTIKSRESRNIKYENNLILAKLLKWYDKNRRDLPWRAKPGEAADSYKVWLSEIMLQQTTVQAVAPYFKKFTKLWPSVEKLAAASQADILKEWAGLGYYARGRNLHKCAQMIVKNYAGKFPTTLEGLNALPGVGPYTAGAIAAIAFNKPCAAVDGNVERVLARLYAIETPLPALKKQIFPLAQNLVEANLKRPSDTVQALMDLGATICTPKSPKCGLCPWQEICVGKKRGIAPNLPMRLRKKPKPQKKGFLFLVINEKNQVLLERRAQQGLLAGMVGLPTTSWQAEKPDLKQNWPNFLAVAGQKQAHVMGQVRHSFTHFDLDLDVLKISSKFLKKIHPNNLYWSTETINKVQGLPSVFKKAILQTREG